MTIETEFVTQTRIFSAWAEKAANVAVKRKILAVLMKGHARFVDVQQPTLFGADVAKKV
jgi:hypothetical protein